MADHLTATERLAKEELLRRGYSEITKTYSLLPDFICDGRYRYEVKTVCKGNLQFSRRQISHLRDDDHIMVYDKEGPVCEFLWKDRNKSGFGIIITNTYSISLPDELKPVADELSKRRNLSFTCAQILKEYVASI